MKQGRTCAHYFRSELMIIDLLIQIPFTIKVICVLFLMFILNGSPGTKKKFEKYGSPPFLSHFRLFFFKKIKGLSNCQNFTLFERVAATSMFLKEEHWCSAVIKVYMKQQRKKRTIENTTRLLMLLNSSMILKNCRSALLSQLSSSSNSNCNQVFVLQIA